MSTSPQQSMSQNANRKLFTVESANAALPLVKAVVGDVVELSREILERRERLASLKSGRHGNVRDIYADEVLDVERQLEADRDRLYEFAEELLAIGVELKDVAVGLVDFPSLRDGRTVYLCWKLGEPGVRHWHDLDAGFSGRKPIAEPSPSTTALGG